MKKTLFATFDFNLILDNFTLGLTHPVGVGGGGGAAAGIVLQPQELLPVLVDRGLEVEVDLPLGVEHQLAGTDGADLVVGQGRLGVQIGLSVETEDLVHLGLVLSFPLPG